MVRDRVSTYPGSRIHLGWALFLASPVRRVFSGLFNPYRPERYYMRGPGPKWHAKHPGLESIAHH